VFFFRPVATRALVASTSTEAVGGFAAGADAWAVADAEMVADDEGAGPRSDVQPPTAVTAISAAPPANNGNPQRLFAICAAGNVPPLVITPSIEHSRARGMLWCTSMLRCDRYLGVSRCGELLVANPD